MILFRSIAYKRFILMRDISWRSPTINIFNSYLTMPLKWEHKFLTRPKKNETWRPNNGETKKMTNLTRYGPNASRQARVDLRPKQKTR